ncbi:2586_t:CDS:1, partial [Funneliformis mosseae]
NFRNFWKSVRRGNSDAQYILRECYRYDIGVSKNLLKGEDTLERKSN